MSAGAGERSGERFRSVLSLDLCFVLVQPGRTDKEEQDRESRYEYVGSEIQKANKMVLLSRT